MNTLQPQNGKISIHEPLEVTDAEHPEEIFDRDILKRSDLAKRILARLREGDCPRALGIYGGWGTGKTSLLNLMKQLNEHSPSEIPGKLHILSIDAWEHESSEGLLIPVVAALDEIKGADVKAKQLAVVVKRALFASGMVFAGAIFKKYTDVELKDIQEGIIDAAAHDGAAHETILRKWKNAAEEIKQTKQAFTALIDSVCRNKDVDKIIICIDNLDRCSPDNVVRLLESVKVFFNVPGCTWLFAMDSEVIANYINHKYEGARMDGNSYLDKIIPEQYHLSLSPAVDGRNIVRLLRYTAGSNFSDFDEEKIPQIPKALVPRRLIKSAGKVSDFYRTSYAGSTSFETVFHLTLLYHTWPDFYQRLSSTSNDHICGILDNFFSVDDDSQVEEKAGLSKTIRDVISLDKKYTEDHDLSHFLKIAFKDYKKLRNEYVDEIINGMMGLRLTGLP